MSATDPETQREVRLIIKELQRIAGAVIDLCTKLQRLADLPTTMDVEESYSERLHSQAPGTRVDEPRMPSRPIRDNPQA